MEWKLEGPIWIVIGFVANEIFSWTKERLKKDSDEKDEELQKNTEAVHALTLSVQKLEIQLGHLNDKLKPIPRMQSDLNEAHAKIRELKAKVDLEKGR